MSVETQSVETKSVESSTAGLGFRRGLVNQIDKTLEQSPVNFFEIAPENWIEVGGRWGDSLRRYTEQYPFFLHGLSLSIGSYDALNIDLVKSIKQFMKLHNIDVYSEHLSYCSAEGHLYDLMPIPFTMESVKHVAERIHQVQDILGQRLIVENVSFYAELHSEMTEQEFLLEVLQQADCELLLDVNNVYVNSINHNYDPIKFIQAMPTEKIRLHHIAGHFDEADDLKVDTHGAAVIEPVWQLLKASYAFHGVRPTLLERDFNYPDISELYAEVQQIQSIQAEFAAMKQKARLL